MVSVALLAASLCLAFGTGAHAQGLTLEYRYWAGFYGPTSFDLRYEWRASPWGLRVWTAHGWDDDTCAPLSLCYHDTFWGLDLTRRVAEHTRAYIGYQNLYRDVTWQSRTYFTSHAGLRVGVTGDVALTKRLAFVYDVALSPADRFTNTWESGVGTGAMYQLGVRYTVSPAVHVALGWWSWGFNLPHERCCDFTGHIWLGPYVALGTRF